LGTPLPRGPFMGRLPEIAQPLVGSGRFFCIGRRELACRGPDVVGQAVEASGESETLFHNVALLPGHGFLPQREKVLPMSPVWIVTFVSGSTKAAVSVNAGPSALSQRFSQDTQIKVYSCDRRSPR